MNEKEEYKEFPITLGKINLIPPKEILENIYSDIPELTEENMLPSPDFIFASDENKLTSPEELFSKIKPIKKLEKLQNKKK
ncbi:MAG: hypothetical protein KatS3mg068_0539 [Candidatus Sericytochromatia bacterium]|nr:MAG: hypothetical protein KatS3mg068_0539 [Candidatus Sericytochromatia bacterium]